MRAQTSVTVFRGATMEAREVCNIGGESVMRGGRGGFADEYTSGGHCQRLRADEDLQPVQSMSCSLTSVPQWLGAHST